MPWLQRGLRYESTHRRCRPQPTRAVHRGADVAKRIAAPMWGGLLSLTALTLLAPASPFPYTLDTTKWDDYTYRLEASGRPSPVQTNDSPFQSSR